MTAIPIGPKNTNLAEIWDSCLETLNSVWRFQEKSKMYQPIGYQGGHFDFPIGQKNPYMAENIETLLLVKFRLVPFSGFRGEVESLILRSGARTSPHPGKKILDSRLDMAEIPLKRRKSSMQPSNYKTPHTDYKRGYALMILGKKLGEFEALWYLSS